MTKDGGASGAGIVKQKAWKPGSVGGSILGQTLLRATGLTRSFITPHSINVLIYISLKALKPCSVNGAGERSSQAPNAVSGLPAALMYCAILSKPCLSGMTFEKR